VKKIVKFKHHGFKGTRIYSIWRSMIGRCFYECVNSYNIYGGRGITVCDEWKNNFLIFKDWAYKNGYKDNLVIDRIDNDKNYEPDNCQWLTNIENVRKSKAAKLNIEKVKQIRQLYKTGNFTHKKLSDLFGTTRPNITKILNNYRWIE